MEIKEVMYDALKGVKECIDTDMIMGSPVNCEDGTVVIPVSKVIMGFATFVGEAEGKYNKIKDLPVGSIGGGSNIRPLGFLVIRNRDIKFVKVEGEEGSQWLKLIDSAMNIFSR